MSYYGYNLTFERGGEYGSEYTARLTDDEGKVWKEYRADCTIIQDFFDYLFYPDGQTKPAGVKMFNYYFRSGEPPFGSFLWLADIWVEVSYARLQAMEWAKYHPLDMMRDRVFSDEELAEEEAEWGR